MSDAQQLALLDETGRVHKAHFSTEYEAAQSMRGRAASQRELVLKTLREHPDGLTDDEGAALLGWGDRLKFGRRRQELCMVGIVGDSGARRHTPLGHRAIVWKATTG